MAREMEPNSSGRVSLLIEHSHGTLEVVLSLVDGANIQLYQPAELHIMSGSKNVMLTHSVLANALSMQKWMEEHLDVFSEGLTSFA